jgi:tetratricopeptide (TPR) repeat protein
MKTPKTVFGEEMAAGREDVLRENALLRVALTGLCKEAGEAALHVLKAAEQNTTRDKICLRLGQIVASGWSNPLLGVFSIPFRLLHEYVFSLRGKISGKYDQIQKLYQRARGGYANYALPSLKKIADGAREAKPDRGYASLFLSRCLYDQGQYEEAHVYSNVARDFLPQYRDKRRYLDILCLLRLKRYEEASRILAGEHERQGDTVEVLLLRAIAERNRLLASGASRAEAEKEQLRFLNAVFALHDLAPLALRDPAGELTIANIHTPSATPCAECALKVSVLMPAYNAEDTIAHSLRSLLEQTWTNLEILVVDDASSDATVTLVEALARKDARIRLIRREKNGGAYAARNTALALTTGDLITVQDSDDWSHAQKIALQAQSFVADASCVANISH